MFSMKLVAFETDFACFLLSYVENFGSEHSYAQDTRKNRFLVAVRNLLRSP